MARSKNHGNGRLEDAMTSLAQSVATLIQNQAAFVAQLRENDVRIAEFQREAAEIERENKERFARIEELLLEHNRILQNLPESFARRSASRASSSVAESLSTVTNQSWSEYVRIRNTVHE
jgi:septal ring factor EnvC (AmiA/AmiB activator)